MGDVEVADSAAEDHLAGPPEPGDPGDAGSDVGDARSDVGAAEDHVAGPPEPGDPGDARSDEGDAGNDVGDARSDVGDAGNDVGDAGSDVGDAGSDDGDPPKPAARPPEGAVLVREAETPPADQRSARRTAPRGPRRARLHALKILYQADLRGLTPQEALGRLEGDPWGLGLLDDRDQAEATGPTAGSAAVGGARRRRRRDESDSPLDELARRLVLGVHGHRAPIDALISRHARRWAINRMPVIDRSLLRLATFELLDRQLPAAVVINEAVDLAKSLSTDDSGRFVNGVLDAIRRDLAQQAPGPDDPPGSRDQPPNPG